MAMLNNQRVQLETTIRLDWTWFTLWLYFYSLRTVCDIEAMAHRKFVDIPNFLKIRWFSIEAMAHRNGCFTYSKWWFIVDLPSGKLT